MEDKSRLYQLATDLLEDLWLHMDWDNVKPKRRITIWQELEGQVKGLSRCYSKLEPFIDKLGSRFETFAWKSQTKEILKEDHEAILNIYRFETKIPILYLKLRRDNAKNLKK